MTTTTEALCLLRSLAFVPAPRNAAPSVEVAAGAALMATAPMGADAFVFKGAVADVGGIGKWKSTVNQ